MLRPCVASEAKVKRLGVGAVGRNTVREFFRWLCVLRCGFRAAQTGGAFVQQRRQLNVVDQGPPDRGHCPRIWTFLPSASRSDRAICKRI